MNSFSSLKVTHAYPEIILFSIILVYLFATLFINEKRKKILNSILILVLVVFSIFLFSKSFSVEKELVLNSMYMADSLSYFLKGSCLLVIALLLLYSASYLEQMKIPIGEFTLLVLFGLLGQFVMVSAYHLLIIYMGIELLSLSLIALVALNRDDSRSVEAAMKYFVLAALASGFLLYGMSMLYGATGNLEVIAIFDTLLSNEQDKILIIFSLVFIMAGLAFKLGAVPFHMWVPDVYQGSSLSTTLLISSAPKIAAVGMIVRLLVDGLPSLAVDWQKMFLILAALSLVIGNFVAVAQSSIKRMMAYSTIGHVGFIVSGIASGDLTNSFNFLSNAYGNVFFYAITYAFSVLGCFGVLLMFHKGNLERDDISDLSGVMSVSPLMAWCMVIFMFSLAGIPPTIGFYAKFVILQSLLEAGYISVAIIAILASVVGAFYYLRIVKIVVFDGVNNSEGVRGNSGKFSQVGLSCLSVNGTLVLLLGIFPGALLEFCTDVVERSFGG